MHLHKPIKLFLHLASIAIKVCLIYFVASYVYRSLTDEDDFYRQRGINTSCQSTNDSAFSSPLDPAVCSREKFKRFFYFYIDSLPLDLFEYGNNFTGGHSKTFRIKHFGITDSGPVFSSFATGKISNKYEGSIAGLDNVFGQFARAGYEVRAFGYFYPVLEMLGTQFFASYDNTRHGLHRAYCEEFIDLTGLSIEGLSVSDSLVFDQLEYFEYLDSRYRHFKGVLRHRKQALFECLSKRFEGNFSHFNYEVYTDTIGHQFSRQSKFYLNKISALKANLDVLFEFVRDRLEDSVLLLLSDHGVVSSLWETEISNHGSAQERNESFLFVFNKEFHHDSFDSAETLNSFDVCSVFAQLIQNVNLPMNYRHMPPLVRATAFGKFAALRQKETQILQYLSSFSKAFIDKNRINVDKLSENGLLKKLEGLWSSSSFEHSESTAKLLEDYFRYVEKLNEVYLALLKTQASDKQFVGLLLQSAVCLFFIGLSAFLIWVKTKEQGKKLFLVIIFFASLPVLFLLIGEVVESLFVSFNFLLLAVCLIIVNTKRFSFELSEEFKTKVSILTVSHILLFILNIFVERDSFLFFYYQNSVLQVILSCLAAIWSVVYLKHFLKNNRTAFFNAKLRSAFLFLYFFCDLLMFVYELKLIFSLNYFQNTLMIFLSRFFYVSFVCLVVLHFNFYHKREQLAFAIITKFVFWFGHNYLRIAYYAVLLPAYFLYLRAHKENAGAASPKSIRLLRKAVDFFLLIYHALFVFHITRGRLDTNISVRVGNKNWGESIEEIPAFTAVIFTVNKSLPFLVTYLFMLVFTKKLKDLKLNLRSLAKAFNCQLSSIGIRLSDIWFGCLILIYLNTFDDPEKQRASFMFYISGLFLIITFYSFAVVDSLVFISKRKAKPKYLPVQQNR